MEFKRILADILEKEEYYKVFKTLWNSGKSFSQIKKYANINMQKYGIAISEYNKFLEKILNELESKYCLICFKLKKGKKYYEISKDIGKMAKKSFLLDLKELMKTRTKKDLAMSLRA